jgi:flavin-dependent dehydrogenase
MTNSNEYDAVIIGAGPAGAAAATLLAGCGRRVLVLERCRFPRYHIGESLIPFAYHPLERLGLIPKLRQSAFVKKYSVQFVSPSGKASQPFYFFTRYDRETVAQTWQVLRSEFDQLLVENARERGATVLEEVEVTDLLTANPVPGDSDGRSPPVVGVRARHADSQIKEYHAPITLDCSGRESFAAVRRGWRLKDPQLNKVAVWTYYEGARRDPGIDAGATTVAFVPEKGWFWYIPQHNDRVSVGVVAEGRYLTRNGLKTPEAIFQREIHENKWIEEHLAPGRQVGSYHLTNEYSFHARHCGSPGLVLVGDAFCFLDPVFSSGLLLALKSGVMAADAVNAALAQGNFAPQRFAPYARTLRTGIENMRRLVYAFYNPDFSFRTLTDRHPDLAGAVTDCLSGDVDKDYSDLWRAIAGMVAVPDPLPVGEPAL